MRRPAWALAYVVALVAAPTVVGAHPGDHGTMSFGTAIGHALAEHWPWLGVVALLVVLYALDSARKSRAAKDRAKRPPIR